MQKNIFQLIRDFIQERSFIVNGKFSVFIICIVVSLLFWLLTVLSNSYTTTLTFQLKYTNFPPDKIITNKLPSSIDASVTAKGFLLYSNILLNRSDTLFISEKNSSSKNNGKDYFVATNQLISQFVEQLNNNMKINFITTDTINFYYDKRVFKVLPVKLNFKYMFEKQYQLSGMMKVSPTKVVISGPVSILDKLTYIETEKVNITHLNKSLQVNLPLKIGKEFESLDFSSKIIVVNIPVERYTEANIEIPISVSNVPENYTIKTFPDKIKVKYTVALSNFEKVKPEMFTAVAEYNANDSNKSNKLKVSLAKTPDYVLNWQIYPQKVEYILQYK